MSNFVSAEDVQVGDFIQVKFQKPVEIISKETSPENPGWVTITTLSETGETVENLYSNELMLLIRKRSSFNFDS